ncbi:hypothetical protein F66182_5671 [Fusarium sp. NRRL 66182]|nr:hypothetical protein F66182_5671 [Fusarium sp. NRRL 66182]
MWSTHDLACAHCRARKIRCGRERPQCESCKRDGVECRYSSPGKRINHVKLLCQNFEALEDHLSSIQSDLSDLTSLVRNGSTVRSQSVSAEDWVPKDFAGSTAASHHIVRNTSQSLDRYHGPYSLYTLCKEFHDDPVFRTSGAGGSAHDSVSIRIMLQEMLNEASNEPHLDIPSHPVSICLQPRQFLNLVVGQFFNNTDYATDIFVRSNFQPHVDRIYSQPMGPSDEGWAVCFNVIVLLSISKEHAKQDNSHFFQFLLQTLRMAVNNPRVFLAPRLVNVQALALLSYVAEQYSTTSLAELIFAQACLLARTMGLHQSFASSKDLPPEDILERQKLFRSLYIRDANNAIFRGSTCWLSGYDPGIHPSPVDNETEAPGLVARIELAKIQADVYQASCDPWPSNSHHPRHSQLLTQLQQKLEKWSSAYQVMEKDPTSTESASLMLSFFATRHCLLKFSDNIKHLHQKFKDSMASCLIFLLATTARPNRRLSEALVQILGNHRPLDQASASKHVKNRDGHSENQLISSDQDEIDTSALSRLAAAFPLASAFTIARHIVLQPMAEPDDTPGQPEEEMAILEALRDQFASAADQAHAGNLVYRFSRVLDLLARIVRQKRNPEVTSTPSMAFNELSSLQSTRSSSSLRESVVSSFRDTPPGPENHSTVSSISEAVSNSSMLLPFIQPLESSAGCSPWFGNVSQGTGSSNAPVLVSWPGQYKRQSEEVEHAIKRPRLFCHDEFLEVTTGFAEHGSRTEDDSLFTFDFLNTGNDIPVFDMED